MTHFNEPGRIVITCPKGIAPYLRNELTAIGFPILSELVAGVETEGTLADTMNINLRLRTGHRVLFLVHEFTADNPEELYEEIGRFPWETYIDDSGYLSVTSTVDNITIRDPRYANVKVKDGIVDRFFKNVGRRPDSGPRKNRTVIHLFWQNRRCAVYLDTSGEPVSRHGYRKIPMRAPMQETLAAATIGATGWSGDGHFVNPMCGSGTLAIEAALIAVKRPPGLLRSNFGFMHIKGFDRALWKKIRADAYGKTMKSFNGTVTATDIDRRAVEAARKNAETAGVKHLIDFKVCDFSVTEIPPGPGIIMVNPEYGERLGEIQKLKDTYRRIGDFFKQKCQGYRGYIFTGNLDLAKHVGLRTQRRLTFFNGPIECRLLEYDIYEGGRQSGNNDTA
ncbi:MAG: class I SAM-dependent RNA methyltransferase [Deltaproteobacteria bacterium]|nr:class I SAM-dependent RNA methyltransferase [Deltaproteobacteria bacterium]MBN2688654.1 class I SAM-dependent RNA methyltransferase [Deltaproteobacteria bacterium]